MSRLFSRRGLELRPFESRRPEHIAGSMRKKDPKTGKRRNLGTFSSRSAAKQHERDVQFFKRH
jgi:hypothetical protein